MRRLKSVLPIKRLLTRSKTKRSPQIAASTRSVKPLSQIQLGRIFRQMGLPF